MLIGVDNMSTINKDEKNTNKNKLSFYLNIASGTLIIIGILIFILRIILDTMYGGSPFKSVESIFIVAGLLISIVAYALEKNWKEVIISIIVTLFVIFILFT